MIGIQLRHALVLGAICLVRFGLSQAATYCVNTPGALSAALSAAQTNGQDDTIKVVAGNYTLAFGLEFNSSEAHSIIITGSYDATCSTLTNADTTLDGQHAYRPLTIENSNGAVTISRMGFTAGVSSGLDAGAGLRVDSTNGDVYVSLSRITGSSADAGGGFSLATTNGRLTFLNNLVANNQATNVGGGGLFQNASTAHVVGNTIVDNHAAIGNNAGGIAISGNAQFVIANNILWGNSAEGGYDLYSAAGHDLYNNDVGIIGGTKPLPDIGQGNLNVDPGFVDCSGSCA